eukprot:3682634-Rhodomonas_salina.2
MAPFSRAGDGKKHPGARKTLTAKQRAAKAARAAGRGRSSQRSGSMKMKQLEMQTEESKEEDPETEGSDKVSKAEEMDERGEDSDN